MGFPTGGSICESGPLKNRRLSGLPLNDSDQLSPISEIAQVDYGLGQKWFLPPSGLNGIRENLASYHSDNESGISLCRAIREGLPPFWNVHVQWMFCEETVMSIRLWSLQLPKTSNGKKVRQFFCCFKDSIENSDILTMQRVFDVALNQRY